MSKWPVFILLSCIVLPAAASAQKRSSAVKIRPLAEPSRSAPPYQLHLKVGLDTLDLSAVSPDMGGGIAPLALNSLIHDLPPGGDKFNPRSSSFPQVIVEADPNVKMLDLWNPISLFPHDRSVVTVMLPGGLLLKVPESSKDEQNVKPNPLALYVTIDKQGALQLNQEPAGTLADTSALREKLISIFQQRRDNGTFRENSSEVETSVTIMMPVSAYKFSDLITIANAVKDAGSKWIYLSPDFGSSVDERKPLISP